MQLALQRQQRHGRKADWTAWNQALAVIWLIGVPDVIDAAAAMDRVFWTDGTRIKTGQITDDDAWAVARDRMGSARLDFVNAAGRNIVRSLVPVTDLPSRGLLCLGSSGCRNRALISPLRPKPPLAAEQNRDRRSVIP